MVGASTIPQIARKDKLDVEINESLLNVTMVSDISSSENKMV